MPYLCVAVRIHAAGRFKMSNIVPLLNDDSSANRVVLFLMLARDNDDHDDDDDSAPWSGGCGRLLCLCR